MTQAESKDTSTPLAEVPVKTGALAGAVAYITGYVTTWVFFTLERSNVINDFSGSPDTFEMVGWLFYNAYFVPVEPSEIGDPVNILALSSSTVGLTVPRPLWTLSIVAVLVFAGLSVAARSSTAPALAGASIVTGFLPLSIVGSFVFTTAGAFGQLVRVQLASPETFPSSVLAGIAVLVVCGAIGGRFYDSVSG